MLEVPSFVKVEGLTLATAENRDIARKLPLLVGRAMGDKRAQTRALGHLGQIVTVDYRPDPSIKLETALWDSKIENRAFRITKLSLGVFDQDGGASFEAPVRHIAELNLSTDAVLIYILDHYSEQYPL